MLSQGLDSPDLCHDSHDLSAMNDSIGGFRRCRAGDLGPVSPRAPVPLSFSAAAQQAGGWNQMALSLSMGSVLGVEDAPDDVFLSISLRRTIEFPSCLATLAPPEQGDLIQRKMRTG